MIELIRSDTNLFGEALALLLFSSVFLFALHGMRRGWRRRSTDAAARYGAAPQVPRPTHPADGSALCTGTTTADSRVERVALPELFGRWQCDYWVTPDGLLLSRQGGVTLKLAQARGAGTTGAHAGRAVGAGRIAVVRWTLGSHPVDTGLQFATAQDAEAFLERLNGASSEMELR